MMIRIIFLTVAILITVNGATVPGQIAINEPPTKKTTMEPSFKPTLFPTQEPSQDPTEIPSRHPTAKVSKN